MEPLSLKALAVALALTLVGCTGRLPVDDTSGNVYEGDYTTGSGQSGHMVLQLKFAGKVLSGSAQAVANGKDVIRGTVSGDWQKLDDAGGMGGSFTINNETTPDDFEFTFTGNTSGISGTYSLITNSPEKSTSSNGSFSLTATGATVAQ